MKFEPWAFRQSLEYRILDGKYQVCDGALHHVCLCDNEEMAKLVVYALNQTMKYFPAASSESAASSGQILQKSLGQKQHEIFLAVDSATNLFQQLILTLGVRCLL